jgi:hypothetical protein
VTQWAGSELQGSFNWTRDGKFTTLLGVDGRLRHVQGRYEVSDFTNETKGTPLFPLVQPFERQGSTIASYLQMVWQPAAVFGLNAGARLDYDPRFDPVVSPRVAATTKPWRDGTLKAVYSEAFRAPSYIESATFGPIQLPAKELTPETVRSIEGTVEQRFGSQRILFGAFRSWWTNMIGQHVLTAEEKAAAVADGSLDLGVSAGVVTQYRNTATIDNYGFNTSYEGSVAEGRLRYGVNLTAAVGRRVTNGVSEQLPMVPRLFGNLHLSYDLQGGWPIVAFATHVAGERIADRAYDGGWSKFPVAAPQGQLRGTISGPVPVLKGLSYRLSANYTVGKHGPYVVGFNQGGTTNVDVPELVPVDTFRATVGLQYDFLQ